MYKYIELLFVAPPKIVDLLCGLIRIRIKPKFRLFIERKMKK